MEKTIQINQKTETFKNILTYVLAASISLAAVCFSAKVWMIDLNIPIVSGGDSLWISTCLLYTSILERANKSLKRSE